MFVLNDEDKSIYATRGDIVFFSVTATDEGKEYTFKAGDVVRIKIFGKKKAENVVLEKDFPVLKECTEVEIYLDKEDTKIGDVISKPKDYWYEIELNPLNNPQTIIGYDEDGAKVFKLFPEGADIPAFVPTPEDIPFIDSEMDLTSPRPVENQAVARAVTRLKGEIDKTNAAVAKQTADLSQSISGAESEIAVERARIDNLAAGTTADGAEVVDIRVGANGITYNSAGTAVREQLAAIKRSLANNYVRLESKNLVNKDKFTYGYYVDYRNGGFVEHADSAYTELIEIKPDTNYTYSMHATNRAVGQLAYYDAASKFISGVANSGVYNYITLASPKNAKYVRWTIPVGYVDMVSIVEGAVVVPYEDYYPCIPDKYIEKFVEVGEGCEFTSILRALKKTSPDTTIYIKPGVYNIVHEYKDYYGEDFFDKYSGYADMADKFTRGLWLDKGRKVIGVSNVELVFDYAGDNSNVHDYFSVIANDADTLLENVTIKVNGNCRYHIHDDFQPQNGTVTFRNLVLDGRPSTPVFIGGGVGKNVTYLLDRIVFVGDENATYDISYHGNTRPDTEAQCKIDVTNCYGNSGCAFRWYGASEKVTLCTVSDSQFSKIECIPYDENQPNENMKLIEWSNKGDKGDKGDQGEKGEKGAAGKTAYEYARDGGFTGTETEFAELMANPGSGGGGVSSWNDLKDKPFELIETVLVEETTIEMAEDKYGNVRASDDAISIELEEGQSYKVIWDSATYECICEDLDGDLAIGNGTIFGYETGNNEPFYITFYEGLNQIYAFEEGSYTISIIGKKVNPIDPEYLPQATENTPGAVTGEDVVNFVGHADNCIDLFEGETTLHELAQLCSKPLGYVYFQDSMFVSFATSETGYGGKAYITMRGLDLVNLKPVEIKVTFVTDDFEDVANESISVRYADDK